MNISHLEEQLEAAIVEGVISRHVADLDAHEVGRSYDVDENDNLRLTVRAVKRLPLDHIKVELRV